MQLAVLQLEFRNFGTDPRFVCLTLSCLSAREPTRRSLCRCDPDSSVNLTEPLVTDSAVFVRAKRLLEALAVPRNGQADSMRVEGFYLNDAGAAENSQGRMCPGCR